MSRPKASWKPAAERRAGALLCAAVPARVQRQEQWVGTRRRVRCREPEWQIDAIVSLSSCVWWRGLRSNEAFVVACGESWNQQVTVLRFAWDNDRRQEQRSGRARSLSANRLILPRSLFLDTRSSANPSLRMSEGLTMAESWHLNGKVLVACNCDWGCPCNFNALPTKGKCEGGWTWHVEKGSYGDVDLDGLSFSVYVNWPGAIHEGNGEALVLLDER